VIFFGQDAWRFDDPPVNGKTVSEKIQTDNSQGSAIGFASAAFVGDMRQAVKLKQELFTGVKDEALST